MANVNCLAGMQCPECGSYEPFLINVQTSFEFYDDGSGEQVGDMEWTSMSYCECVTCGFYGHVEDFEDVFGLGDEEE